MIDHVFYTKLPLRLSVMAVAFLILTLLKLYNGVALAVPPFQRSSSHESPQRETQPNQSPEEAPDGELVGYEKTFPAMGTLVTFKSFHADRGVVEAAFTEAERRVHELAAILTDYDPESEARQLSLAAIEQPVQVSEDLWKVLVASDKWYRCTDGAFDSSLGALTSLWRKYRRAGRVPTGEQIRSAMEQSGWRHVELDRQQRTVQIHHADLRFDFGAIGKGYIVDEAFEVLMDHGLSRTLVNISGNMRVGASPPNRRGWVIEIAPVEQGGEPLRRVRLADTAVATSGDLWQFIVIDGQRRSHILDPTTGLGVVGPVAATAIAKTATDSDALATSACILGWETALKLTNSRGTICPAEEAQLLVARRQAEGEVEIHCSNGFPVDVEANDPRGTD